MYDEAGAAIVRRHDGLDVADWPAVPRL